MISAVEDGVDELGADLVDRITELVAYAATPASRADVIAGLASCVLEALRWRDDVDELEEQGVTAVLQAARTHQRAMIASSGSSAEPS